MEHKIKIFPVGNGDCILVKLDNGKTILVDCQIREDLKDDKGKQVWFDVKSDLLKELSKDSKGRYWVDLYISTHPHDDHCKGFEGNFYHGAPDTFDETNDKDKICIGELWLTSYGFKNDIAGSATEIRREAKRRRKLYDNDEDYTGGKGNYLRVIGYDEDNEYDSRYGYIPGKNVSCVNGSSLEWLEIFIHAPFKEDIAEAKRDDDKNATSIVIQLSFYVKDENGEKKLKSRVLLGGDAEHQIWQHILDNNTDDEKLKWNIFVAPHHCSWTFFNDSDKKDEVLQSAKDIMAKQIGENAVVVASSEEILDDNNNPPCFQARTEYKSLLKKESNFYNTAIDDVVNGIPKPIVFKIGKTGKRKEDREIAATTGATSRPAPRAGLK